MLRNILGALKSTEFAVIPIGSWLVLVLASEGDESLVAVTT
jgi:hypothetical protein